MAHALTIKADGTVEMAYATGVDRWHGLGNEILPTDSHEDIMRKGGLDWRALRARVRYATGHGMDSAEFSAFDGRVVLFRSDNKNPLSVVSDDFKIYQPSEAYQFVADFAADHGGKITTLGTLHGGTVAWAQITFEESSVGAGHTVRDSLLVSTSFDGTRKTEGRDVTTVVVCANTLARSDGEGSTLFAVSHRTRVNEAAIREKLEKRHDYFAAEMDMFRRLADTKMQDSQMLLATAELFKPGSLELAKDDLAKVLRSKPVARVNELAIDRAGLVGAEYDGMQGTAWGWLNSVTQYVDHEARAHSPDNRFESAWLGKGSDLKLKALEIALAMADGSTQYVTGYDMSAPTSPPADNSSLLDAILDLPIGK